jgi:uncharacterized membrane protein YeaQ/YmgE (transglycosylase-associated protein family)
MRREIYFIPRARANLDGTNLAVKSTFNNCGKCESAFSAMQKEMRMNIIGWIVLGGLAGWIASMIMGTNEKQGCITDIIVGIIGAIIGGFLWNFITRSSMQTGFNIPSIIIAVIGACILLAIKKAIFKGK